MLYDFFSPFYRISNNGVERQKSKNSNISLFTCQNSDTCKNAENSFFIIGSDIILKIKVSSLQRPLKTCYAIFFHHFIEFRIMGLNDRNSRNSNISSFNPIVQNLIKRRERNLQQVLRGRCKKETSIFKIISDLIMKKKFSMFLEAFEFLQLDDEILEFLQFLSPCQNIIKYKKKKGILIKQRL